MNIGLFREVEGQTRVIRVKAKSLDNSGVFKWIQNVMVPRRDEYIRYIRCSKVVARRKNEGCELWAKVVAG